MGIKKCVVLPEFLFVSLVSCYAASGGKDAAGEDGGPESWCPGGAQVPDWIAHPGAMDVDVLVVMDNTTIMAAEQRMAAEAFPHLIEALLTGIDPESGLPTHTPVRSLHLGVVSTDMGVGGYPISSCRDNPLVGDDGILQHEGHGEGCSADYPSFLYQESSSGIPPGDEEIESLARDFGCIVALGTDGCGFEQQLEAARKAFFEQSVPGGPNAGFLRVESILAVIFISDEEDCSAADTSLFDLTGLTYSVSLRCFYEKAKLHPVQRYVDALRSLQPLALVAGFLVGVPAGDPSCEGKGDTITGCLDVPAMQEIITSSGENIHLACTWPPGCREPDPSDPGNCVGGAFPGRRYVELAQALGPSAFVSSICTDSFLPFIRDVTRMIIANLMEDLSPLQLHPEKDPSDPCRCVAPCLMTEKLSNVRPCPSHLIPRDEDGDTVADIEWDGAMGVARTLCEVSQAGSRLEDCSLACDDPAAVHEKDTSGDGWWYDPNGVTEFDVDGDTRLDPGPALHIDSPFEPQEGSKVTIECCFS
jgi:hypothetical protein